MYFFVLKLISSNAEDKRESSLEPGLNRSPNSFRYMVEMNYTGVQTFGRSLHANEYFI